MSCLLNKADALTNAIADLSQKVDYFMVPSTPQDNKGEAEQLVSYPYGDDVEQIGSRLSRAIDSIVSMTKRIKY